MTPIRSKSSVISNRSIDMHPIRIAEYMKVPAEYGANHNVHYQYHNSRDEHIKIYFISSSNALSCPGTMMVIF